MYYMYRVRQEFCKIVRSNIMEAREVDNGVGFLYMPVLRVIYVYCGVYKGVDRREVVDQFVFEYL